MALFAVFILFIVVGIMALAIDFAMIYHSKAKVSRTVDAIAIRVVNRYSRTHTSSDRQRIAESIFVANFGLLRSATTVAWAWTNNGASVTSTSGETLTGVGSVGGDQEYRIVINTIADADTGVVVSNVTATALHRPILIPSFFKLAYANNPTYADQYEKYENKESAEAERFPSVNAIIVDLSGSMRGNGGADGISGTTAGDGAVVKFVESFDEDRDYMLLVGFSNGGKVLWPPEAKGIDADTGIPYFKPSRKYITADPENQNITIKDVIQSQVAYTGWTNGAEGLRMAAQQIQHWLDNEPDLQNPTIRKKIKVNYVFMTDGSNNTFRTYLMGYGHGIGENATRDYTPPVLSIHNTFHAEWPLVVRNQASLLGMSYDTVNLATLLNAALIPPGNAVHPENMAGVAANFTGNERLDDGNQRYVRSRESTGNFEDWTGVLIKETGLAFDGRWATNLTYDTNIRDQDDVDDAGVDAADYVLDVDTHYERFRVRSSQFAEIPRTLSNYTESDFMNPGLGHDYYAPAGTTNNPTVYSTVAAGTGTELVGTRTVRFITRGSNGKRYYFLSPDIYQDYKNRFDNVTDDDVNMTNQRCQYVPMGEVWANHQGSFLDTNGNGDTWNPSEALTPWIFLAGSNSRRTFVSQRVTDFYPTYSFDGPTKELRWSDSAWETRLPLDDDTDSVQQRVYSWKDGGDWDPAGNPNEKAECDFLMGAQAQILRQRTTDANIFEWQDATIYTIRYGGGGNGTLLKEMANDASEVSNTNSATQNEGLFYDVADNSSDLVDAFEDIANRIAVRISK